MDILDDMGVSKLSCAVCIQYMISSHYNIYLLGSAGPGLLCARGRYCPAGTLSEILCPLGTFTPHQGALSKISFSKSSILLKHIQLNLLLG